MPDSTMRELIEQGKARHVPIELDEDGWGHLCAGCEQDYPCLDLKAYEVLERILNDAELISGYAGGDATKKSYWRSVCDPTTPISEASS